MKRKTNLFNLSESNDTNFLTFSNYTEYLTGNFLSTDTKLYPSTFLCMDLPFENLQSLTVNRQTEMSNELLTEEYSDYIELLNNKYKDNETWETITVNTYLSEDLIDEFNDIVQTNQKSLEHFKIFLMVYYENKLATIRNYLIQNNQMPENVMEPLGYLIESIHKFFNKDIKTDPIKVNYVSNIVEQDYKGTYTDSMCIVNLNESAQITSYTFKSPSNNDYIKTYENVNLILEGWQATELEGIFPDSIYTTPIYDNYTDTGNSYNVYSSISHYNISNIEVASELSFNTIIPLFDIMNIEHPSVTVSANFSLELDGNCFRQNIPLGIWTTNENINIKRYNGFAQNWSLVIGSKFSPMPYGTVDKINDVYEFGDTIIDEITNSNIQDQQALTYVHLLYRQNELYNKYSETLHEFNEIKNTLNEIQTKLNQMPITYNLDKVYEYIDKQTNELKTQLENNKADINERIANLKWKLS